MKNSSDWKFVILFLILIYLISYFSASIISSSIKPIGDKIALIRIYGPITITETSEFPFQQQAATTNSIIENIKKAKGDKSVKAVILEINSPGGTVVATQELADAVSSINKPTVAYIREVGASGAYWVATSADKIVASPMSITGSIGVISSYLEFSKLFEKYGITYQRLASGEFKDTGSPYKELNPVEKQLLQRKLDIIYDYFVEAVAKNRNMSIGEVRKLADGSFYLGTEAKELGLVDYLGDKNLAINITKELAGLEKAEIITYKEKTSLFSYLTKLSSYYIGQGIGSVLFNFNSGIEIKT